MPDESLSMCYNVRVMHTVKRGDITVLRITVALLEQGEIVLRPVSEESRYDIALDRNGTLYRIQCKTGKLLDSCVRFSACSSNSRDYVGQIDAFGVYCPQNDKVYLVPIEAVRGRAYQYLRVDPNMGNGGGAPSIFAEQFEIRHGSSNEVPACIRFSPV